jgi:hypothetical protein
MSLDADSELLGAVQVLPGNGDEARDAATLLPIDQQLAAMAADQEMQHELRSIEEDFAHAAADGLDTP